MKDKTVPPASDAPSPSGVMTPALRAMLDRRTDEMLAACAPYIMRAERAWDELDEADILEDEKEE